VFVFLSFQLFPSKLCYNNNHTAF